MSYSVSCKLDLNCDTRSCHSYRVKRPCNSAQVPACCTFLQQSFVPPAAADLIFMLLDTIKSKEPASSEFIEMVSSLAHSLTTVQNTLDDQLQLQVHTDKQQCKIDVHIIHHHESVDIDTTIDSTPQNLFINADDLSVVIRDYIMNRVQKQT